MPIEITINGLTGTSPYDIYLCDNPVSTCVYIDTISSAPYTFTLPEILDSQNNFNVKIIDDNNCIVYQNLTV